MCLCILYPLNLNGNIYMFCEIVVDLGVAYHTKRPPNNQQTEPNYNLQYAGISINGQWTIALSLCVAFFLEIY